jgi:hypothetical protein
MKTTYTEKEAHELWRSEQPFELDENHKYTMHRMSYGDYYVEPFDWQGGERDGFSPDTKWLEKKIVNKQVYYIIK